MCPYSCSLFKQNLTNMITVWWPLTVFLSNASFQKRRPICTLWIVSPTRLSKFWGLTELFWIIDTSVKLHTVKDCWQNKHLLAGQWWWKQIYLYFESSVVRVTKLYFLLLLLILQHLGTQLVYSNWGGWVDGWGHTCQLNIINPCVRDMVICFVSRKKKRKSQMQSLHYCHFQ